MALLKWALILAVLALIAGVLGFSGLAEGLADVAKFLFLLFVGGVILLVILDVFAFKSMT